MTRLPRPALEHSSKIHGFARSYRHECACLGLDFQLQADTISTFLNVFTQFGREVFPTPTGEILVDQDDLIFYEVAMERQQDNSYLVTGNLRHYPVREFIVTPAQMMEILGREVHGE